MEKLIYIVLLNLLTCFISRVSCVVDDGSGDDWTDTIDVEGSGEELSECFRHQQRIRNQHMFGMHIPQCTPDGRYVPVQCNPDRRQCWCVDEHGRELPGSALPYGQQHHCSDSGREHGKFVTDDSIFVETTPDSVDEGKKEPIVHETDGPVEIATVRPPDQDTTSGPPYTSKQHASILAWLADRPILLGIIIGALVLLILILLLCILFLAYRMKKSGEGSYSLDEPKRALLYTSIKDKEFYA